MKERGLTRAIEDYNKSKGMNVHQFTPLGTGGQKNQY
ncbi:hypothetical protein B0H40_003783 [Clostridium beijerinckii]|nr:hypothetical protein [Clostridium beijerinckii]